MDFSRVENDSVRAAVSELGTGVDAAASMSRRSLSVQLLRQVETACTRASQAADLYRGWAGQGTLVLEAVATYLGDKIDASGDVVRLYDRGLESLSQIADDIRAAIQSAQVDERLDGTTHRNDLVDAFSVCLEAMNELCDVVGQIRGAIVRHDSSISEVELTAEELEHVQRCMANPKAPKRDMAASVDKLKELVASKAFSLSR